MKKHLLVMSSLMAVTSAVALSNAIAAPAVHKDGIRFECAHTAGGVVSERLVNYGTYISGMGEENAEGKKTRPLFRSPVAAGANIPADLTTGGYSNAGTTYNPSTGRVSCMYKSASFDPFTTSYVMANGINGYVVKSSNSDITIKIGFGADINS